MNKKLKYVFLGATRYSEILLSYLIDYNLMPCAIFSIPKIFKISYSDKKVKNYNYADLRKIAFKKKIPFYLIDGVEGKRLTNYEKIIKEIRPDVILALGWYFMVPKKIRECAKYGTWGIHAALLPNYAGGAPLVWAMINGEKETGITLFRLSDGVDDGDIIEQTSFPIEYKDTIKEVYEKAILSSKEILIKNLLSRDEIKFKTQEKTDIKIYPQREPKDGEIDLNQSSKDLYNFIRAQSSPYPGAFIKTIDGKKLVFDRVHIENM